MTPAPMPIDIPRFCGSFSSPVVTEKLKDISLSTPKETCLAAVIL